MVETKVFSGVLLGIGMLMLSGCYFGLGPRQANALDVPLEVRVRYHGIVNFIQLTPGLNNWDSHNRWLQDRSFDHLPIEEIAILEGERVLHQFFDEDARFLLETQDRAGGWWCIDREKVYLALSPNRYPDAREYCSKGKRLWMWQNGRFSKEGSENP